MNNPPSIRARHLQVRRDGRSILHDVHLDIAAGEFVVIVGKSGAGKSTLLHALAGHLPSTGELHVPERMGMVFQKDSVFPWMTVEQNIRFGMQSFMDDKEAHIAHCLRLAGLEDKAQRYPAELSGGQAQRISIAREFCRKPDVLLMDEPFGSLDVITREAMQRWLLDVWRRERMTVVMVTHSIEEALVLADRIILLRDGTVADEFGDFRPSLRENGARFSFQCLQLRQIITEAMMKEPAVAR